MIELINPEPPPLPGGVALRQQWMELAYFHWPYPPELVQQLLPAGVTVDTFDGAAWVGLIPFEMRNVQLGPTPAIPWLGSFIEINVRTYVTDALGRRAVWFFSLDVPRAAIVAVARTVFSLPYCWASARHTVDGVHHRYTMSRRWPRGAAASADMAFSVGDQIADCALGELEHFLSARWALLTTRRDRLLYGRVEHPQWPLHHIHECVIDETLIEAAGLPRPRTAPNAMYSPGVDVQVASFQPVHPN